MTVLVDQLERRVAGCSVHVEPSTDPPAGVLQHQVSRQLRSIRPGPRNRSEGRSSEQQDGDSPGKIPFEGALFRFEAFDPVPHEVHHGFQLGRLVGCLVSLNHPLPSEMRLRTAPSDGRTV